MDIASIPRIDSVVLTGLDFSMKPESARFEADKGFIKPFPEIKVMHQVKALAVMVYNQEKMTPYYHSNVCYGRNPLAHFICAVHRQQAPQPKMHSRQSSNSSNASASSFVSVGSCQSNRRGKKNCELPKLVTTSMLPLGYWDGLYYSLVAEIRQLHSDLQNRFGFGCENGTEPLHQSGPDGFTSQPITAIDLASMLETAWYSLMDNRLVATLDDAVRMRKMREHTAKQRAGIPKEVDTGDRPPVIYGLMDVNALSPEAIIGLLWDKHAPEIDRACSENFEDESMLTAYRAELHAKFVEEGLAASTPLPSAANICSCHRACVCKLKCDKDADQCTCKNRVHIFHRIDEPETIKSEARSKYVKQDKSVPNHFLGNSNDTFAQLQVSAMARKTPSHMKVCSNVTGVGDALVRSASRRNRKRTNTNNSELAYVPGPPYRNPKDAFPLDFYGRNSGQRYPTMQTQVQNPFSDQAAAFYVATPPNANAVTRKPVPPPITAPTNLHSYQRSQSQPQGYNFGALTPPTSSPWDMQSFAQACQVTYPAIPVSHSQSMFTQSFPAPTAGNPREPSEEGVICNNSSEVSRSYIDPADDYIGLLSRHPSTTYPEHPTEAFPRLSRTVTTSPPKKVAHAATTNALPSLKALKVQDRLSKAQPPLPEPEFIAPRPALKQRYVSAGGNAKLSERPEIPGPAFTTSAVAQSSGGAISKEEVDAKMSDPEWIRRNFGESAVAAFTTPPRKSAEESKRTSGGKPNSGRKSDESARTGAEDKRDRTSSGASGRVAKLKRVFSRKNSQGETEF